jgi:hypothetical protein
VTRRWTAHELLDLVLDEGTFVSWDEPVDLAAYDDTYRAVPRPPPRRRAPTSRC